MICPCSTMEENTIIRSASVRFIAKKMLRTIVGALIYEKTRQ